MKTLSDLKALTQETAGTAFTSVVLLNKITARTARTGAEFLVVDFSDATGTITCNCFSNTQPFNTLKATAEGAVIQLSGQTDYYQDRLSPRLQEIRLLPEEEAQAWLGKLIPASAESPDALWEELQEHIASIAHGGLRQTVERVFEEIGPEFRECPGAIAMHHAYRHGLMEHTVHIARAARVLFPVYPQIDPDLALAGALLHDVGKTVEYTFERITKKSRLGQLQGHVVLGYRLVRKAAIQSELEESLIERLEHIILSHQGELEWGAAVMAATPEAVFVSLVDNLDAKMGVVQHALRNLSEGFSPYLPALKASILTSPVEKEAE